MDLSWYFGALELLIAWGALTWLIWHYGDKIPRDRGITQQRKINAVVVKMERRVKVKDSDLSIFLWLVVIGFTIITTLLLTFTSININ